MPKPERPLPPPAPAEPGPCVYGGADPAEGWRWFSALGRWERVCHRHFTPTAQRKGDYVPDIATTERQAP